MKSILFSALFLMGAIAHAECTDYAKLSKAAESAYSRSEQPNAGEITYLGTTKTGKDKFSVQMNVNEECLSEAIIYTKQGTCQVLNVINLGLGEGACG